MAKLKNWIGHWLEYALYRCGIIHYFDKPDPPPPPDYAGAAREQGTANVNLAVAENRLNNPNIITPYGTQTVTWDTPGAPQGGGGRRLVTGGSPYAPSGGYWGLQGGVSHDYGGGGGGGYGPYSGDIPYHSVPQATITQTLSPSEQRIFDLNQDLKTNLLETGQEGLGRVRDAFSVPWDTSGAPQVTAYADMDNTNDVYQSLIDRYMPEYEEDQQQAMDNLLIQGHTRGGEAWNTESRDQDRTMNDFRLAAMIRADNERRANNALQHQIETSDRGRYINEMAYNRNVPLNEVNALRSGNQIQPYQYV